MKIFPDVETRKQFMKQFLPVILGVAWTPIIWIMLMLVLAPLLIVVAGAWTQLIVLVLSVLAAWLLLKLFRRFNFNFYERGQDEG
jgi:1,4-dihydroxy-2-naphthoate octaprenyltransferase